MKHLPIVIAVIFGAAGVAASVGAAIAQDTRDRGERKCHFERCFDRCIQRGGPGKSGSADVVGHCSKKCAKRCNR